MSKPRHYDYIVVGAGVEGSSTAYQLVKQGHVTLLLEQFPLPHTRGSSHGYTRTTRKSYGLDDFYTQMMGRSNKLLEELEQESGEKLFQQTGVLIISKKGHSFTSNSVVGLKKHGLPFEQLTSQAITRKYPMMSFPADYTSVFDHGGGMLKANKILAAYHDQFRRYGGTLIYGEGMVSLSPGRPVKIHTKRNTYTANGVVLACGPWSKSIMTGLGIHVPLTIQRVDVCYWKERRLGSHSVEHFPVFSCFKKDNSEDLFYGMPSYEYPGLVKVCCHHGPEIDPDDRDRADGSRAVEDTQAFVKEYLPGLVPEPSLVEKCIYSMTPDQNFYLDKHPDHDNIVIAAGFSGHGFKLAPVVGLVLSQLVAGKSTDFSLEPFRLDRFKSRKDNSKL